MKKRLMLFFLFIMYIYGQAQNYEVGDHELLIMPTAYTMEQGDSYFSDYELFFLNYTYGITSTTHLGIFTLFPITTDFLETLTFGAKQNYLNIPNFAGALWATYTPKISGLTLGNVFSVGKKQFSFHLGLSGATEFGDKDNGNWEFIYMAGLRGDASRKVSILVEYTNFSSFVEEEFNGFITLGVRFRGETIAWELGGLRPLESTGDLIFIPVLKATVLFK